MSIPGNVRILETRVAGTRYTVVTEFLGSDHGFDTPEGRTVAFFDTWIDVLGRVNIVRDATPDRVLFASDADWTSAMVQHDRAISFARKMAT